MAFLAVTGFAYYRLVWTARPDLRREVPAQFRIRRIVLAGLAVGGVFALLSLPLLHAVV
ncbi:hypothetical protein [Halorussus caseinilyticus]|uniref:Uncharacterized protein n=2 Tax=Halorussus caseinilyticus TaxID=3034025 RepID=A0ABD5WS72_9EURY